MKIPEAYEKGLLIVGEKVSCTGSDDGATIKYTGTIYQVSDRFLSIKRDDGERGAGKDYTWRVLLDNEYAEIYFKHTTMQVIVVKQFTTNIAKATYNGNTVYIHNKSGTVYSKGKHTITGSIAGNIITVFSIRV